MKKCKNEKKSKKLAYGQRYNKGNWCRLCDCHFEKIVNKKGERQKTKNNIRKELKNLD